MSGFVFNAARQKTAEAMAERVLVRKVAYRLISGRSISSAGAPFSLAGEALCVRRRLERSVCWSSCHRCTGTYFGSMMYALIDPECAIHGATLHTVER